MKVDRMEHDPDKKWLIEGASVEVEIRTDLDSSLSSHAAHVEEWVQAIVDAYPVVDPRIVVLTSTAITKESKE